MLLEAYASAAPAYGIELVDEDDATVHVIEHK